MAENEIQTEITKTLKTGSVLTKTVQRPFFGQGNSVSPTSLRAQISLAPVRLRLISFALVIMKSSSTLFSFISLVFALSRAVSLSD